MNTTQEALLEVKNLTSKSKVNFYRKKVNKKVIPILRMLEKGEYPTSIAFLLKTRKQNIFYYIKKLEKAGLIYQKIRSNIAIYELTVKGKKFLGECEGPIFSSNVFRLHNCRVKYPIFKEGVYPEEIFKIVKLVNWVALLGFEQGVRVRKTSKHWIIECDTQYGKNPAELYNNALNMANRVAQSLMLKYGVVLGEGKIQEGFEVAGDDPVANFVGKYFQVSSYNRKIDHSELSGEIDHLSKDAVIEYLLMPERIGKIEKKINLISNKLENLSSFVRHLGDLLE